MKKKHPYLFCLLTILFLGCSKDDGNSALADSFTPNVSFAWKELKGRSTTSKFSFTVGIHDDNAGTGSFSGFEIAGSSFYDINGTYNREQVQLFYLTDADTKDTKGGPDKGLTYKGFFTDTAQLRNNKLIMRLSKGNTISDSLVLGQNY